MRPTVAILTACLPWRFRRWRTRADHDLRGHGGVAESSCSGTVPKLEQSQRNTAVDPVTFYEKARSPVGTLARRIVRRYLGCGPAEFRIAHACFVGHLIHARSAPTLIFLVENDRVIPMAGALVSSSRLSGWV